MCPRRRIAVFNSFADTMSRMESVHQSSQAPTALPGDVVSALHTLHEFVATATSIPPQIIVTCRDDKRAFGRAALQAMSYRASALLSKLVMIWNNRRKQLTCSLPDSPRRKTGGYLSIGTSPKSRFMVDFIDNMEKRMMVWSSSTSEDGLNLLAMSWSWRSSSHRSNLASRRMF